ncbi:F-box and WD repeat domain containing protein 10B-like isoform X1 [Petromyzon marinus]|uniref:F-box and WD repeat domain containing protein 10B-like isoform X1 n=1 Tax=Petromyzon marinus TaxID=7757 RepID=UPI003F6FBC69
MREATTAGVDADPKLRCHAVPRELTSCGRCQACVLTGWLDRTTAWLGHLGHSAQRDFVAGLLLRTRARKSLSQLAQTIQLPALAKDLTYARSVISWPTASNLLVWTDVPESLRGVEHPGREASRAWQWFSSAGVWSQALFLLGALRACDPCLSLELSELVQALVERQHCWRTEEEEEGRHGGEEEEEAIGETRSSSDSFRTEDHPDLQLLVAARRDYCAISPGMVPPSLRRNIVGVMGSEVTLYSNKSKTKIRRDRIGMETFPRHLGGVGNQRDLIRSLPVHLAKYILGILDQASLSACRHVSLHWRYLVTEVQKESIVKQVVRDEAMALQGTSAKRVNPVYARLREVEVPALAENGLDLISTGDMASHSASTKVNSSFSSALQGIATRVVHMEERNVYCSPYNVLIVLQKEEPCRVVAYAGGHLAALGSIDRHVRLLDVERAKEVPPVIRGHAGSVRAVLVCQERGLLLSGSYDLSIRSWNMHSGACLRIFRGHQGTVTCLALHGDCLVSGAKDAHVKVWDIHTGRCLHTLKHRRCIRAVGANAGHVASGCEGGLVKLWHLESGSLIKVLEGHRGAITSLALDAWHLVTGGVDGFAMTWSILGRHRLSIAAFRHPREVLCVALLYLRVVTGCADGKIRVFNLLSGDCLRVMRGNSHSEPITYLATSDSRLLINTPTSVLVFQFEDVRWDYDAASECVDKTTVEEEDEEGEEEKPGNEPVAPAPRRVPTRARRVRKPRSALLGKTAAAGTHPHPLLERGHTASLPLSQDVLHSFDLHWQKRPMTADQIYLKISAMRQKQSSEQLGINAEKNHQPGMLNTKGLKLDPIKSTAVQPSPLKSPQVELSHSTSSEAIALLKAERPKSPCPNGVRQSQDSTAHERGKAARSSVGSPEPSVPNVALGKLTFVKTVATPLEVLDSKPKREPSGRVASSSVPRPQLARALTSLGFCETPGSARCAARARPRSVTSASPKLHRVGGFTTSAERPIGDTRMLFHPGHPGAGATPSRVGSADKGTRRPLASPSRLAELRSCTGRSQGQQLSREAQSQAAAGVRQRVVDRQDLSRCCSSK